MDDQDRIGQASEASFSFWYDWAYGGFREGLGTPKGERVSKDLETQFEAWVDSEDGQLAFDKATSARDGDAAGRSFAAQLVEK